jgi:hypothetical protein
MRAVTSFAPLVTLDPLTGAIHRSTRVTISTARHAATADLPADEILPVADTVIVRPDPELATA